MYFTLCQLLLILGEQDWDRASFQIEVSDLIQLLMEGRLSRASGPAPETIESVTFILHTVDSPCLALGEIITNLLAGHKIKDQQLGFKQLTRTSICRL